MTEVGNTSLKIALDGIKAEAAAAERERCAKILDDRAREYNHQRDPGMANHCRSIAAEIRKPS